MTRQGTKDKLIGEDRVASQRKDALIPGSKTWKMKSQGNPSQWDSFPRFVLLPQTAAWWRFPTMAPAFAITLHALVTSTFRSRKAEDTSADVRVVLFA